MIVFIFYFILSNICFGKRTGYDLKSWEFSDCVRSGVCTCRWSMSNLVYKISFFPWSAFVATLFLSFHSDFSPFFVSTFDMIGWSNFQFHRNRIKVWPLVPVLLVCIWDCYLVFFSFHYNFSSFFVSIFDMIGWSNFQFHRIELRFDH